MQIFQTIITALTTENELLTNILVAPLFFLEAYLNMLLFTTLFNIPSTKKCQFYYVLTFASLSLAIRYIVPTPFSSIINLCTGLLLIKYFFHISFVKAFLCELVPTIIMLLIELVFTRVYYFLFNITFESTITIPLVRITTILIIYAVLYAIYKCIKHFKIALVILDGFSSKSKLLLSIDIVAGFILLGLQLYLTAFYINNVPAFITLLSSLCLIAYFIISIYSIVNIGKLETTTNDLEHEQLYNKSLAIMHDKVRGFKHDFANIMQALGGYIDKQDMEGLRNYYDSLKKDCMIINNLNILNPDTINHPAIYSLLSAKYHRARECDIHFDLDIFLDFSKLDKYVSIYEFTRIFGILLDNAIEASNECEYKHMILKIYDEKSRNCILVRLQNTFPPQEIHTDKLFQKGYSTKPGNTGLGLWEVHKYLSKHPELDLYTQIADNYFTQDFRIYYGKNGYC